MAACGPNYVETVGSEPHDCKVESDETDAAAFMSGMLGTAHGWEMLVRLGQSLELTDALWDLVPAVVATSHAQDQVPPVDVADRSAAGQRLNADDRDRARSVADNFIAALEAVYERHPFDEAAIASIGEAEFLANPFGIFGTLIDPSAFVSAIQPEASGLAHLSADQVFYLRSYITAKMKEPRTPTLLRALFVTVVGTIEPLVTRLVRILLYQQTPSDYASLADSSLDDESRRLCYGSPWTWRRVLVERFGISSLDKVIDWQRLSRLWQDRNVIVHRGSVIDTRHSLVTGSVANTALVLEPVELRGVIDEIGAARFGLVAGVWDHMTPGMGAVASQMSGGPFIESLRAGRWRQAEGLARLAQAFATDPESAAAEEVNRLLARDVGLGLDAIRNEVEQLDSSALGPKFQLARHILLRQDNEAVALLRELLADGHVEDSDIRDWPIFDRLRSEGRLDKLDG